MFTEVSRAEIIRLFLLNIAKLDKFDIRNQKAGETINYYTVQLGINPGIAMLVNFSDVFACSLNYEIQS